MFQQAAGRKKLKYVSAQTKHTVTVALQVSLSWERGQEGSGTRCLRLKQDRLFLQISGGLVWRREENRGNEMGSQREYEIDRKKAAGRAVKNMTHRKKKRETARLANTLCEEKWIGQYLCRCCSPLCRDNPCRKHQSAACLLSRCRSPVKQSGVR